MILSYLFDPQKSIANTIVCWKMRELTYDKVVDADHRYGRIFFSKGLDTSTLPAPGLVIFDEGLAECTKYDTSLGYYMWDAFGTVIGRKSTTWTCHDTSWACYDSRYILHKEPTNLDRWNAHGYVQSLEYGEASLTID